MLFLHNIVNSVWMIEPGFAANYLPLVTDYLSGKRLQPQARISSDEIELTDRNGIKMAIIIPLCVYSRREPDRRAADV